MYFSFSVCTSKTARACDCSSVFALRIRACISLQVSVFMVYPLPVFSDKVKRTQIIPCSSISIGHYLVSQLTPFVELDNVIAIVRNTLKGSVISVFLLSDFHDI